MINSTITGPKDSAGAPSMNQGRISGMLPFSEQSGMNKMGSPFNSAISGNLGGVTNTAGSDDNAPGTFSGITVEPNRQPPGAVVAANDSPMPDGVSKSALANAGVDR